MSEDGIEEPASDKLKPLEHFFSTPFEPVSERVIDAVLPGD